MSVYNRVKQRLDGNIARAAHLLDTSETHIRPLITDRTIFDLSSVARNTTLPVFAVSKYHDGLRLLLLLFLLRAS